MILSNHIIEQTAKRKNISGTKAEFFLKQKFDDMLKDKKSRIFPAGEGRNGVPTKKIVLGDDKIVYSENDFEYVLITYIVKKEIDKLEYRLLNLVKYFSNKK